MSSEEEFVNLRIDVRKLGPGQYESITVVLERSPDLSEGMKEHLWDIYGFDADKTTAQGGVVKT